MKILQLFALSALMIQGIYANDYDKALIEAAEMGDLNKVKSLVAKGANVNARDEYGFTVLMNAVSISNKAIRYLESKGIKPYKDIHYDRWKYDMTDGTREYCIKDFVVPLADISHFGHLEVVKYLISKGADIHAKVDNKINISHEGEATLMLAASSGQLEIVKYLIAQGANVNNQSKFYLTALKSAAGAGQLEVAKYLISKGAKVNMEGEIATALLSAVRSENVELVKYLIAQGADVNAYIDSPSGKSALMFARKLEIIKALISAGARVNDDMSGETLLLRIAKYGETCGRTIETLKYLISVGADINAKDNDGNTALSVAKDNKIKAFLRSKGAR